MKYLKIVAICVICAATLMSGCLEEEGDCKYEIDQSISDRDAEWQQRWNNNELRWERTIKDRDAEWDRRWKQNNEDWAKTVSNRDKEWRKQLEDNDAQWRELIENRDAEWEALMYQAIANRDAEWEYAISQNSDQQTLDFIMQVLPLLFV